MFIHEKLVLVFATDEVTRTTGVIGQGKILFAHVRFVFLNLKVIRWFVWC